MSCQAMQDILKVGAKKNFGYNLLKYLSSDAE